MARIILSLCVLIGHFEVLSQCAAKQKLIPESSTNYWDNFGSASDVHEGVIAIGAPDSDLFGPSSGAVFIYQMVNGIHTKIATLKSSQPKFKEGLGSAVLMSDNYILVGGGLIGKEFVYVFKRPPGGWAGELSEIAKLETFDFRSQGYYPKHWAAIASDEQTIAVFDVLHPSNEDVVYSTALIFHKNSADEWQSTLPASYVRPRDSVAYYGVGFDSNGDLILPGYNQMDVFRDLSGNGNDYKRIAKLPLAPGYVGADGISAEFGTNADGIFVRCVKQGTFFVEHTELIAHYQRPPDGQWKDAYPDVYFSIDDDNDPTSDVSLGGLVVASDKLYYTSHKADSSNFTLEIKKGTDWGTSVVNTIWQEKYNSSIDPRLLHKQFSFDETTNTLVAGIYPDPTIPYSWSTMVLSDNSGNWITSFINDVYRSSEQHQFGETFDKNGDYLFVTAPQDGTLKKQGGAVYIYKDSPTGWQQYHKIFAPYQNLNEKLFGSNIAVSNQFLAIGAAGYGSTGSVFMYRNDGQWLSPTLTQTLEVPSSDGPLSFGEHLSMNDSIVAVTLTASNGLSVCIYEQSGGQWSLSSVINLDHYTWLLETPDVDVYGNTIVCCGTVIKKTGGVWTKLAKLNTGLQPWEDINFGIEVEMTENAIFITRYAQKSPFTSPYGVVYAFTKKIREEWSDSTKHVTIDTSLIPTNSPSSIFGTSLSVQDDLLLIGAPFRDYDTQMMFNWGRYELTSYVTVPGNVYLFEATDDKWNAHLVKTMNGDTDIRDNFGNKVLLSGERIFIGASRESRPAHSLSGSVYITPLPVAAFPVSPQCVLGIPVALKGFPSKGTWTGDGVNTANVTFDPALAGVGDHTLTYTYGGCTDSFSINVADIVTLNTLSPLNYTECSQKTFSIPLSVSNKPGQSMTWLFKSPQMNSPVSINNTGTTLMAVNLGTYTAHAENQRCPDREITFTISPEAIPNLNLPGLLPVCSDDSNIALTADPTGGTWTGPGVSNNHFNDATLNSGTYLLTYQYTTPLGCVYQNSTSIAVSKLPPPVVSRSSDNVCDDGSTTLSISPQSNNYVYAWSLNGEKLDNEIGPTINATRNGSYTGSISYLTCGKGAFINVHDNFTALIGPQNTTNVCSYTDFFLQITPHPNETYEWYSIDNQGNRNTVEETSNTLLVDQSGSYGATVTRNTCVYDTPTKLVTISKPDSVFIPNVFTPNGDTYNDVFKVESNNVTGGDMTVINRYGEEIFVGNAFTGWNGNDAPSGVYYYVINYRQCDNRMISRKGPLQLLR